MRKPLLLLTATLSALALTACGSTSSTKSASQATVSATVSSAAEEVEEENYNTGDASLDDPLNADGIGEKELLVVSFGTSYNDSRRLTIGAIEKALAEAFPDWSVRRAFTSDIIIEHIEKRDGEVIDDLMTALDRAVNNGVKTLVIQPTHLMTGLEYSEILEILEQYSDAFEHLSIGRPLLVTDEDFKEVAEILLGNAQNYKESDVAFCYMGHGTEADSNEVYTILQDVFDQAGVKNIFIGTVEAEPDVNDVIEKVKAAGYKKVVLLPLMVVAGDHANNDMAGDEPDSWKSLFEKEGFEVTCILEGLGQSPDIRDLYVAHAKDAIDTLGVMDDPDNYELVETEEDSTDEDASAASEDASAANKDASSTSEDASAVSEGTSAASAVASAASEDASAAGGSTEN